MAFTLTNSTLITQTGTDTDLSGLTGLTGVTTLSTGQNPYTLYYLGVIKLEVLGDLTINPEYNMFISNAPTSTASGVMPLSVRSGGVLRLGVKTVVGTAVKYTTGTAFILTEQGNLNTNGSLHIENGGTMIGMGATIEMAGPTRCRIGATLTIEDLTVVLIRNIPCQFRIEANALASTSLISITENGMTLNGRGANDSARLTTSGTYPFDSDKMTFTFTKAQYQPGSTGYPPQVFLNFDNGNNIDTIDFSYAGTSSANKIDFDNILVDFRNVPRRLRYGNANLNAGYCQTTKVLNFNLLDQNVAGVSDISYYAIDTNNGNRINSNGFDSTADLVYSGVNAGPLLEVIPVIEYMAGQATTRLVDDRTLNDTMNFKFISYLTSIVSISPNLLGLNTRSFDVVNANDGLITETDRFIVGAYTDIDNSKKFYDVAKLTLDENYVGEAETVVSRVGDELDARALDVDIDPLASKAYDATSTKITIRATTYTGNMVTTGIISLLNGAEFIGIRTDANGTIFPPLNINITNIIDASRLQIFNNTTSTEILNQVISGTSYTAQYADGTGYSSGDVIRVRLTNQVTTTAYLGFEAIVVATATGWNTLAAQQLDTAYNTLGIDGSGITIWDADYISSTVKLNTATNFELDDFYAWWVYNLSLSDGISSFFGGITALDIANFRINVPTLDLFLDNDTTGSFRQLDNRRVYRTDEVYPVKQPSTTGFGLDIVWRNTILVAGVDIAVPALTQAESANLAEITSVKTKTDQLEFTGTDLKATLDGEEVVTDLASRNASKADVSALSTFDASTDAVANVTLVGTTTSNTDMRGTDGANTIAPTTAPTVAEIRAGFVANDFKATTTVSSNMRGTDSANTVVPDNTTVGTILTDLTTYTASALPKIRAILIDTDDLFTNQGDWVTADVSGLSTFDNATDEVVTDTASRDASKGLTTAEGTKLTNIDTVTKLIPATL